MSDYILLFYAVMALLVGSAAYRQFDNIETRKRIASSVIMGCVWPVVFGLFVVMLIDDVRERFQSNGYDSDYDE